MAEALDVSRTNYYKYLKRCRNELDKFDPVVINFVHETWLKSKRNYGLVRILGEVKKASLPYGARKVRKLMKLCNIRGKQEKRFRIFTTDSDHSERIAPDLIKRDFKAVSKNQRWVSDVTFIRCLSGWFYLCVIIDLYSRKVVGWSLSKRNDSGLVLSTLKKAIESRNPSKGLIFHSDRGSNYCSREVRGLLLSNKIRRSNSRKGNCWDNAVAESFFISLKREMEYNVFYSIEEATSAFFDHIEVFYNRQRSYSFLGYVSPLEFEERIA